MRRKRSDASLQNRQDGVASSRMARRLRHQRTAALLSMAKMLMLWATLGVVPEQDRRDTRDTLLAQVSAARVRSRDTAFRQCLRGSRPQRKQVSGCSTSRQRRTLVVSSVGDDSLTTVMAPRRAELMSLIMFG